MTLQNISDLATIFGSLAVFIVMAQVWYMHLQLKSDHERSRREKSVDILMEWSKNLKKEGSLARKIIECLNEEQCRDVYNQREMNISKKHEALINQLFGGREGSSSIQVAESILLTEAQTTELRWHVISYLNSLEIALVAWQYSIVDKDILESQFSYLFRPADGHELLKYFRKAAGGENTYPAIEIFAAHLSEKRRKQLIAKANVI